VSCERKVVARGAGQIIVTIDSAAMALPL
jgi:hypothetical protein